MTTADPGRSGPSGGFRFPPQRRLTKAGEIRRVLKRGTRERTSHLDVFHSASPVSRCRLGFIVPKHGRDIVDRNLLKRRLREIGRTEVLPRLREAEAETDLLLRARPEAYEADFHELRTELIEFVEERWPEPSSSA